MNAILNIIQLTFLPRVVPATKGSISGISGVSRASLLICSINALRSNGPVGDLTHA